MKNVLQLSTALAMFALSAFAAFSILGPFSISSALMRSKASIPQNATLVVLADLSDADKYEIVMQVLQRIDPEKDHVMERSETYRKNKSEARRWLGGDIVYLSTKNLPQIAVERLPHKKFRYKLILRTLGTTFNERNYSYLEFSDWSGSSDSAVFTQTAYFRGGNIGGCTEKYTRYGRLWKRGKPDCFAIAR